MELVSVALWGVAVFTVVGTFFGVALAAAARKFHVPVDPAIEAVRDNLPSANCGACGFAGCQSYAEKVVGDPDVAPSLCTPGGQDVAVSIGELTGKSVGEIKEEIATLRCAGSRLVAFEQAQYDGIRSCAAATLAFGGPKSCKYGCLGLGDCIQACAFDAITTTGHGIVAIAADQCTGCGLCVVACPKDTLELVPRQQRVILACTTRDKAKNVKSACTVGCTQCLQCIRKCPAKAIDFDANGVINVDHRACRAYGASCNEICVEVCPTYILHRPGMAPVAERKKVKKESKAAAAGGAAASGQ